MGRRWGKTVLGGCLSIAAAFKGNNVAWVVPAYKNGRSLWRFASASVADMAAAKRASINKSERLIEFPNGGQLGIYSADNPDSLRGDAFHLVILDEAARIDGDAWRAAIQPTLADYNGDALLISTPRGRNWFWEEYQRGIGDGKMQASWQAPSRNNPNPLIKQAAEQARNRLDELTYRQEWLAEFVDAEGAVFRRIQEAIFGEPIMEPLPNRQYCAGVDVAASIDYTVVSVYDVQSRQMVCLDRFNRVDYGALENRLHAIYTRWGMTSMTIEANSIGQGVIDHLRNRKMHIIPFTTTSATKQAIIQGLQSAFEHGLIQIANYPVLIGELLSFESKRNASGSFAYSAPDGMHDDCVMSLAIGWQSLDRGSAILFGA